MEFVMAHSYALRIKLGPPKMPISLILFLADYKTFLCCASRLFVFHQISLDISYVSLEYEYCCQLMLIKPSCHARSDTLGKQLLWKLGGV